jgi:hypothetical protein
MEFLAAAGIVARSWDNTKFPALDRNKATCGLFAEIFLA